MDYRVFIFFILLGTGVVSQSSWKSSSRADAGPCEKIYNTTVLNSLGDVSLETIIMDSIEVMSYSRGQLNDWVFRVCRNIDNMASRMNDSCSDRTVNHADSEEHTSFQKSSGIAAAHQYLCSNAGANLKDLVLGNGPQCVQDIERYWRECPETPSRTTRPTQAILTTSKFSPDVCSFLISTETCYMNAFTKSHICIGNTRQHFQTYIGILLEKAGCSDRNVFGKPAPIGFSDVPSFNFKTETNTNFGSQNQFTTGRLPSFGPESSQGGQFPTGSNQFPSTSNQFGSGPNQFPSGTNQFPSSSNQFPQGQNQFPSGSSQFPSGSNQFPSGPNQFPSGPNQFPPGSNPFSGNTNPGLNRGNQFGVQNQPVTPRIYNSSRNLNQYSDPYSRPSDTMMGFNPNQPNAQKPYDQRPYDPRYPDPNGYQNNQNNPNPNYPNPNGYQYNQNNPTWQNQNGDQFAFGVHNSNQNPFDRLDPSHSPGTTSRPGYEADRNFDRYNRSQSGVYMSQSYKGSGSENIKMSVLSLILTLFCSFLLH